MIECRHRQVMIPVFSRDLLLAPSLRGFVASWLRAYFSSRLRVFVSGSPSWLRGSVASWLVLP